MELDLAAASAAYAEDGYWIAPITGRIFAKLGLRADPASHRRVLAVLAHLRVSASSSD